jgi:hypothetical protein
LKCLPAYAIVGVGIFFAMTNPATAGSSVKPLKTEPLESVPTTQPANVLNVRQVETLNNYQGGPGILTKDQAREYAAAVMRLTKELR